MKIAVALITCGRSDYTALTLRTFAEHNDLSKFVLLHGDDASDDAGETRALVRAYGFRTVVQHRKRRGYLPLRTSLIDHAARRARWVLLLENDIETVRPFPWALFQHVKRLPWVYCLRLFGEFKGPNQTEPCKTTHQWFDNAPVSWKRLKAAPENAEVARIHWTAQPAVTRAADLVALHRGWRSGLLQLKTVRVVDNVMVHIGTVRTPGRVRAIAC